jgi:hypothetical protein
MFQTTNQIQSTRINKGTNQPTKSIQITQFTPRPIYRSCTLPGSRYTWLSCGRHPDNTPAQTSHALGWEVMTLLPGQTWDQTEPVSTSLFDQQKW